MKPAYLLLIVLCLAAALLAPAYGESKDAPAQTMKSVAADNSRFAWDLYRNVAADNTGNVFVSPFSISTALGMTYAGAEGETAVQMKKTLCFTGDDQTTHAGMAALVAQFNEEGKQGNYQLAVANALWGQKDFAFNPDFLKQIRDNYDSGLTVVDFAGDTEFARTVINNWVLEKTQKKIKDLLEQGVLTVDTKLVLTNAIYFMGNWKTQFNPEDTAEGDFHIDNKTAVKTQFMRHHEQTLKYFADDQLQAVELPYKGDELSMIILLPSEQSSLAELEKSLTHDTVSKWLSDMKQCDVTIALPKFKFEFSLQLNKTLIDMGMPDAFNPGTADFSAMSTASKLFISAVIHKAFVEVNETGTEAAAATAVVMEDECARRVESFVADRPFVFMIRHNDTGSILFAGRMADPVK